ncbi:5-carboxymethyl-2-hydroxymuconate Delta-isomerase [Ciceribacter lividus]|uniref:5-carboxymethyl-2-hydroxymuconate Delta-isomerase n=1 Tax=Ciceribacter lividus TaxID=1197950 RepID=UPI000DF177BB|nr:5-carboxymethyl-2-hydroxymuconate Delta-isomerase [Ciceribacter lividus]
MPHLTLEYTKNLANFDAFRALRDLNEALAATNVFAELNIKSRAIRLDDFAVGTMPRGRAFVHVKLVISAGRTAETKRALSDSIVEILRGTISPAPDLHVQICAEILEIDGDSYAKRVVGR